MEFSERGEKMSHFTVLVKYQGDIAEVEGRIDEMMEPYYENKPVEDNIEYEVKKKHQYLKEEIDDLEERLLSPLDISKIEVLEYVRHDEEILNRERKKYEEIKKMTPDQYWKELTNGYQKDENGNAVSSYNPDAHWDWYTLGGRWSGKFILKNGTDGMRGHPGVFGNPNPVGIDAAYAEDVDWEVMEKHSIEQAEKSWKDAEGKTDEVREWEYGIHKMETKSEFMSSRRAKFATFAVLDGDGWHEHAEMGWFGLAHDEKESEDDWNTKFFERFLKDLPEDTVLAIVDCHI